ncbi:hypothetical protein TS85_14205 [Sphingomonas hengshuiensis]|uniref:dihydroneopterin aldolase n=2 Tax=Sphingomonas hengshuiensis TaxID=1609977 RepID=A0A7U5BFX8_9SPHN|nr:hypothetical protein TS85_14205 [Sphingomonas hengshuiensis]
MVEVCVTGLQVFAQIGVHAHERGRTQLLSIDVTVTLDPPDADRLDASIDYQRIADDAEALGRAHINLIETFARRLATSCLAHPAARQVCVSVQKPGALRNGLAGTRVVLTRG